MILHFMGVVWLCLLCGVVGGDNVDVVQVRVSSDSNQSASWSPLKSVTEAAADAVVAVEALRGDSWAKESTATGTADPLEVMPQDPNAVASAVPAPAPASPVPPATAAVSTPASPASSPPGKLTTAAPAVQDSIAQAVHDANIQSVADALKGRTTVGVGGSDSQQARSGVPDPANPGVQAVAVQKIVAEIPTLAASQLRKSLSIGGFTTEQLRAMDPDQMRMALEEVLKERPTQELLNSLSFDAVDKTLQAADSWQKIRDEALQAQKANSVTGYVSHSEWESSTYR